MYFDTGNSFSPKRIAQFLCQSSDLAEVKVSYLESQVLFVLSTGPLILKNLLSVGGISCVNNWLN